MSNNPNNFDNEIENANANSQEQNQVAEQTETVNPIEDAEPTIDYKHKFSESAKEAQRLYEENKRLRELAESQKQAEVTNENLYPGFEVLDEDAKKNLLEYTKVVEERVAGKLLKDPALVYAREVYAEQIRNKNEKKWEQAFESISSKYPELKDSRDEFKTKYFQPNNVPDNIESILGDVSKIYLFDKAKEIGASEEKQKASRIDMERANGGDKQPRTAKSLQEWQRLAQENPAKFAKQSKEYHADLESGKLKE